METVGELVTRIGVSNTANEAVAAGIVDASVITGTVLAEMKSALPSGNEAVLAALKGAGSAAASSLPARSYSGISGAAPEIHVKCYKDEKYYERDARHLLAAGWRIEAQSSHQGKVKVGSTMLKAGVFLPWAVMRPARKGDPITVTWMRGG